MTKLFEIMFWCFIAAIIYINVLDKLDNYFIGKGEKEDEHKNL